jgi:hypothetical protein
MIKKSIILFLFVLFLHVAVSQVPGYMGKHAVVGYSVNFFPSLIGPTSSNTNNTTSANFALNGGFPNIEPVGINATHIVNLDYVFHYRKAFCIMLQYAKTGVDYTSNITNARYDGNVNLPAVLNSIGIGIGIKHFKRANLAPYGPYVKWEGQLFLNTIKYNKTNWSIADPMDSNNRIPKTNGPGTIAFQAFGIGFSFGKQRIFKDKIVFDRGVRILAIPAFLSAINSNSNNVQGQFENAGVKRIFRHQLINFHLGIGFLAF